MEIRRQPQDLSFFIDHVDGNVREGRRTLLLGKLRTPVQCIGARNRQYLINEAHSDGVTGQLAHFKIDQSLIVIMIMLLIVFTPVVIAHRIAMGWR